MAVANDREPNNIGLTSNGHRTDDETEARRQRIRRVERERLRRGLIRIFVAEQSSVCTHLCLPDIAKDWAPLRRESTLKAAKEAALDDLMEAVSDGHISELMFLNERAGLENVIASPWCQDLECPLNEKSETIEFPCRLDAKWFADMRRTGEGITSSFQIYLREKFAPYCWANRDAVVAFLFKFGVDRADMPARWLQNSSGGNTNAIAPGPIRSTTEPNSTPQVRTDEEVYRDWIVQYQGKRPPSRDADREHMRGHFSGITQERLRTLRRDLAPIEWTKRGRPQK
jgi:hypothetical protein